QDAGQQYGVQRAEDARRHDGGNGVGAIMPPVREVEQQGKRHDDHQPEAQVSHQNWATGIGHWAGKGTRHWPWAFGQLVSSWNWELGIGQPASDTRAFGSFESIALCP